MWASTHCDGDRASLPSAGHAPAAAAANGGAADVITASGADGGLHSPAGDAAVSDQLPMQPASGEEGAGVTIDSGAMTTLPAAIAAPAGSLPQTATLNSIEAGSQGLLKAPLVLPAPECLRPELNGVDRDLQNTLRCPAHMTTTEALLPVLLRASWRDNTGSRE